MSNCPASCCPSVHPDAEDDDGGRGEEMSVIPSLCTHVWMKMTKCTKTLGTGLSMARLQPNMFFVFSFFLTLVFLLMAVLSLYSPLCNREPRRCSFSPHQILFWPRWHVRSPPVLRLVTTRPARGGEREGGTITHEELGTSDATLCKHDALSGAAR